MNLFNGVFVETILLTGANGFLGSYLLESFLENGYKVVILIRTDSNTWRIKNLLGNIVSYNLDNHPIENVFEYSLILLNMRFNLLNYG